MKLRERREKLKAMAIDPVRIFAAHMLRFAKEEAEAGDIGWAWWLYDIDCNMWLDVLPVDSMLVRKCGEELLCHALIEQWTKAQTERATA